MPYAKGTAVPINRTREHIEVLLQQHKADSIGMLTERSRATLMFRIQGWGVRMRITLPTSDFFADVRVGRTHSKRKLTPEERQVRAEGAARERWRALFLTLKAKLVSVEAGVETFEEAFLPHLVLPGGTTVMEGCKGKLTPGQVVDLPQLGSGE